MLSNLLLWSKAQMQGVTVKLVKVNLKAALKSTFQIHEVIAAEKGIQLTDQLKRNVFIDADTDMLQLVIRNLVNNAIKFTAPGGEIILSDEVIDEICRITVKDNGTGIPFDEQANIFSIKVNSAYGTKNEKGFGLGLVLCKEFTELQKGKISFESTPGTGSAFHVSFPLYPGANEGRIPGNSTLVRKV
jgi:signal transduction histidine kinase